MNHKSIRIVFTGGGTMGHVTPNLAIIDKLREKDKNANILYIGRLAGLEKESVINEGIRYKGIFSGKFRRYFDIRNITDLFLILAGFFQSIIILVGFRPDVIFAKGGFVTVPVVLAGWLLRIPVIAHESDSIVGLSNKIISPFVKRLALGFPLEVYKKIPRSKSFFTGSPVRKNILDPALGYRELGKKYNLYKSRPMILVMGGSQGSARINEMIESLLPKLLDKYIVVHSTGEKAFDRLRARWEKLNNMEKANYLLFDFIKEDLGGFLSCADLVISRAGANSLSEILSLKKISIIIPFPFSSGDHQTKNAQYLKNRGMISMFEEKFLNQHNLLEEIEYLIKEDKTRQCMKKAIKSVFTGDGADLLVEAILGLVRRR